MVLPPPGAVAIGAARKDHSRLCGEALLYGDGDGVLRGSGAGRQQMVSNGG